ncbi:hypothetical protein BCO18430_03422 [Burkholderia contaminans]|uniref:hypothetical protein n=1 Tax=Burkholderia contaminans TaxID=488447 RepID=UPI001453F94A|nr:hypothetical protein [Burkholderia contaminans]VWC93590.1 hypothetical protein BCO18430_03422 [Burkholderia contaminans]
MSSSKRTLAIVAIVLGYLAALALGQRHADSQSGVTVLPVDDANARCRVENHYIGDGQIRGRETCSPSNPQGAGHGRD